MVARLKLKEIDAMSAFGQGKIKIGGNMMLAQKLSTLTEGAKA